MSYKCLLDMDGVLDDFVKGAVLAHGRIDPYTNESGLGCFDMEKLWGITAQEFWKPLDSYDFWFNLVKTSEADAIVALVNETFGEKNIAVLTSPSESSYCISAKRDWVKKYYPNLYTRLIFSSAKEFMAAPNHVLIDDRDKNVEDFKEAGGIAILVPRPWNSNYDRSHLVIEVIEMSLRGIRNTLYA